MGKWNCLRQVRAVSRAHAPRAILAFLVRKYPEPPDPCRSTLASIPMRAYNQLNYILSRTIFIAANPVVMCHGNGVGGGGGVMVGITGSLGVIVCMASSQRLRA